MEISARTKLAALLDAYPQLEEVLIGIAPPFRKLKNPLLRRSVGRVASLRQAAAVANLPVDELVNTLRNEVGQPPLENASEPGPTYFGEAPAWFDNKRVTQSLDGRTDVSPNEMPVVPLLKAAKKLDDGEILELVTTFLPAPGIDRMSAKGFLAWSHKDEDGTVRTYFQKTP